MLSEVQKGSRHVDFQILIENGDATRRCKDILSWGRKD